MSGYIIRRGNGIHGMNEPGSGGATRGEGAGSRATLGTLGGDAVFMVCMCMSVSRLRCTMASRILSQDTYCYQCSLNSEDMILQMFDKKNANEYSQKGIKEKGPEMKRRRILCPVE